VPTVPVIYTLHVQREVLVMSKPPISIQKRARELARSGQYIGWRPIAFELQFEPGYAEASAWVNSLATQEELDALCREARVSRRIGPEAA
jgi:hypothetical protein